MRYIIEYVLKCVFITENRKCFHLEYTAVCYFSEIYIYIIQGSVIHSESNFEEEFFVKQ